MYGLKDKCILNDADLPLPDHLFKNSYQNDEEGKKNFMKLWLHAYCYKVPSGYGFENEDKSNQQKKEKDDDKSE
jgi:hypothetical protein